MITSDKIKVGLQVWYYDNAAQVVNTTVTSNDTGMWKNETACYVMAQKEPVQLKYLYSGHNNTTEVAKVAPVAENSPTEAKQPPVLYKAAIGEGKEEVVITPEIIREKAKPYTEVTILGIADTENYELAKKNKMKLVRVRTTIEKLEEAKKKEVKATLDKIKEYTATLYEACKEGEKTLGDKIQAIDDAKAAELEKQRKALEAKTTERENKMYELGLSWNGSQFIGYDLRFNKEYLFDLEQQAYDNLVEQIETAKEIADNLPELDNKIEFKPVSAASFTGVPMYNTAPVSKPVEPVLSAPVIFNLNIPEGATKILITQGEVEGKQDNQVAINQRIRNSQYYLQAFK